MGWTGGYVLPPYSHKKFENLLPDFIENATINSARTVAVICACTFTYAQSQARSELVFSKFRSNPF
jgi:hypothetical protein